MLSFEQLTPALAKAEFVGANSVTGPVPVMAAPAPVSCAQASNVVKRPSLSAASTSAILANAASALGSPLTLTVGLTPPQAMAPEARHRTSAVIVSGRRRRMICFYHRGMTGWEMVPAGWASPQAETGDFVTKVTH